jgi:hypothetical protein
LETKKDIPFTTLDLLVQKGWNKPCVLWIDCPDRNSDNSFSSCEDEGGAIEVVIVGFNRLLNNCLLDGLMYL